jgi:uncharacterized DUF497 family protein
MRFEFDSHKSSANQAKHGISFEEAKKIWSNEVLILGSKNPDEERLLVIGTIDQTFWTAIVTMRGPSKDIIRIISVRRSRYEEKRLYKKS